LVKRNAGKARKAEQKKKRASQTKKKKKKNKEKIQGGLGGKNRVHPGCVGPIEEKRPERENVWREQI